VWSPAGTWPLRVRDARLVEGVGLYHRTAKYFSPLQQAALAALRAAPPTPEAL
jgi:hypothetical protein